MPNKVLRISEKELKAVDDYSKFMKDINSMNESANHGPCKYTLRQAIYIVENILRAHEEDGFNEMVPSWHEALSEAMKTLRSQEQTQTVVDYIEYCEYLFGHMPLLELHPLDISKL